jgi:WhiB family redox-sensing transcriptional regulator
VGTVVHWRAQAGCRDADPVTFFEAYEVNEAKRICAICPVQAPCLEYALSTRQEDGVWGGASEGERARMLEATRPTVDDAPLESISYRTRTRSTGAVCSVGRSRGGWGVACETHGTRALAASRAAAGHAVSRPQEWCPTCRRIADGDEPRHPGKLHPQEL